MPEQLDKIYSAAIQAWLPQNVSTELLKPRSHMVPVWLGFVVLMFFLIMFARFQSRRRTSGNGTPKRPMRIRRRPLARRVRMWWVHKFDQPWPWRLGKLTVYLTQTHGLIVGGSGSGKSTAVVQVVLQQLPSLWMWVLFVPILNLRSLYWHIMFDAEQWHRRSVLIISFDRSDPIEEATNELEDKKLAHIIRWRVRADHGWNLVDGDIEMLAEAIPDAWSKSADDTGFARQCATDALSEAMHAVDAAGIPREWNDIVARAAKIMLADPETPDLLAKTWIRRFRSLGRVMGPSLGRDFDLISALKDPGTVVHISSNSYTSQVLTPLVGVMGLVQAKLAAEEVPNVILVLEEAAFLKNRKTMLDDLARSMRARGWRIVYISQDPEDVGSVLQVNFGVAIFMGLGPLAQKARQWCADVVQGFKGAFRAEELVLGATIDELEGYVLWRGACRDVSLPPYILKAADRRPAGSSRRRPTRRNVTPETAIALTDDETAWDDTGWADTGSRTRRVRLVVEEVTRYRKPDAETGNTIRALPGGTLEIPVWLEEEAYPRRHSIWSRLTGRWDVHGDHVWPGGKNSDGAYGKTWYRNIANWEVHFLFWAWKVLHDHAQGLPSDLDRFYVQHPDVPQFQWPPSDDELILLRSLKNWMKKPDPSQDKLKLAVDHACPGFPNTLCCNWRHHHLETWKRNRQLRWERLTGAGRLDAEAEDGIPNQKVRT